MTWSQFRKGQALRRERNKVEVPEGKFRSLKFFFVSKKNNNNNNNNNNNTYIALIRMRSKRFTSIVLQYDLEI